MPDVLLRYRVSQWMSPRSRGGATGPAGYLACKTSAMYCVSVGLATCLSHFADFHSADRSVVWTNSSGDIWLAGAGPTVLALIRVEPR